MKRSPNRRRAGVKTTAEALTSCKRPRPGRECAGTWRERTQVQKTNQPVSTTVTYPLEPDVHQMEHLVRDAMGLIVPYLGSLPSAPSESIDDVERCRTALKQPLPERGTPLAHLLESLRVNVLGCSVNAAAPTYQAYIPGGGVFSAALGEFIAAAINRYVGVYGVAPGPVQLETTVLDWFNELVGYGPRGRGILTSGGSLANFSAIVTARRTRLAEQFLRGAIYVSDQVHHSITKAAMLAGFPVENVRVVPSDPLYRMDVGALTKQLEADEAEGWQPFLLVASAGTTNTGAVDPLEKLAELAGERGLWYHVDAAYGGFFLLTERGKELLAGIQLADSITLDPHKGLFLPYGTGCLLVKNGEALRRAHSMQADYLQDLESGDEGLNFSDYSPELSRSFRGLRVWLPLKLHGAKAFAECLDEKLDLIDYATKALRGMPGIEVVADPQLTVVAFRLKEGNDEENTALLQRVNGTRRTFLSSTVLNGRVALRIAILNFRTHQEHVDATLDAIRKSLSGAPG